MNISKILFLIALTWSNNSFTSVVNGLQKEDVVDTSTSSHPLDDRRHLRSSIKTTTKTTKDEVFSNQPIEIMTNEEKSPTKTTTATMILRNEEEQTTSTHHHQASDSEISPRIVGGEVSETDEFPYFGTLYCNYYTLQCSFVRVVLVGWCRRLRDFHHHHHHHYDLSLARFFSLTS